MRIDYLTNTPACNVHEWSGTNHHIFNSLERAGASVTNIHSFVTKENSALLKKLFYKTFGKRYQQERSISNTKRFSKALQKMLSQQSDIIFSPSSINISLLETSKPKVLYTDATFACMVDYYGSFTNLCSETVRNGHFLEKKALENCDLAIYSSEWAANSAIKDYGANPSKVIVIPFGANLTCDRDINNIEMLINKKPTDTCEILFIGVDWDRKGGDIALRTAQFLNEVGIPCRLNVLGINTLPAHAKLPFVKNYGFMSKSSQEGQTLINHLFTNSHFLLVPSKAEAFGIVFAEASSFGVPSLSRSTGGIPSAVETGVNGFLSVSDNPEFEFVEFIKHTFSNFQNYKTLCLSSFIKYEKELNWEVTGNKIMSALNQLL